MTEGPAGPTGAGGFTTPGACRLPAAGCAAAGTEAVRRVKRGAASRGGKRGAEAYFSLVQVCALQISPPATQPDSFIDVPPTVALPL